MSNLTLELDAHRERLRLAAMETEAETNGYPPGWLRLVGSINDETFAAPYRSDARPVAPLEFKESGAGEKLE